MKKITPREVIFSGFLPPYKQRLLHDELAPLAFLTVAGVRTVENEFAGFVGRELDSGLLVEWELLLDAELIDGEVVHTFGVGRLDPDDVAFLHAHLFEGIPDTGLIVVGGGGEFLHRTGGLSHGRLLCSR